MYVRVLILRVLSYPQKHARCLYSSILGCNGDAFEVVLQMVYGVIWAAFPRYIC